MRNSRRSLKSAAFLSSLIILFSTMGISHADQPDLLSLVRAGHRAARQAIHSFSATITKEGFSPSKPTHVQTGQYWRTLDVVRIQEKVGSGWEDYLLKDSEIRQVGRHAGAQPGQMGYGAARRAGTDTLSPLDVWSHMMIDFAGPNGGHYDLDRFLEFAKDHPSTSRERIDGRDYIRITFSVVSDMGMKQNIALWHDVARNYLVWKTIMTIAQSDYKVESEILEFAEPLPGVFFPTKCRTRAFSRSKPFSVQDISLSNLQVNKPIPKSVFELPPIPAGTELLDHIEGKRYPIDENWRSIGPERRLVIASFPSQSGGLASEYRSQSKTEARSSSWWLVSVSLVALVIACIYRIYRHFRSRAMLNRAA